jgi:oxygen-independent coproporphyrinogen III oxidase
MTASIEFDAAMLRRYDRPGPRYTSYPTAPQFGGHFNADMLRTYIRQSNAEPVPRDLSLYVHVPFCSSPCFYCGCNRVITRDPRKGASYVDRLTCEIAMLAPLFDADREVVQLHFGGGTPNFLGISDFRRLVKTLRQHFHFSTREDRDFSIELDPRHATAELISSYAELGLTRASLGVQDFDEEVQRAVNRVQSVEETVRVIENCRAQGFRSINIDLIYGLPKQTLQGFERTLDIVIANRAERVAVYSYAHMPQMFKAQRRIDAAALPTADVKLGLLQLAIDKLVAAGYEYIGMDHFALPNDELARAQSAGTLQRNFMGYTTHGDCDLLGLGVSAISHIGDSFSQNERDLLRWQLAIDAGHLPLWRGRHLDGDDLVRAEVIQQLMCLGRVDMDAIERRFAVDFPTYFSDALARLRALATDGLVEIGKSRIAATSRGRLLLRIIAMCFDRYVHEPADSVHPRYSRVI